ncbi:hypothetical protein ACKWTF_003267 [Chironomus riparius]
MSVILELLCEEDFICYLYAINRIYFYIVKSSSVQHCEKCYDEVFKTINIQCLYIECCYYVMIMSISNNVLISKLCVGSAFAILIGLFMKSCELFYASIQCKIKSNSYFG